MEDRPYTLASVKMDLKEIKNMLLELEKQMSPELHTIQTPEEADKLFSYLTKLIQGVTGIELIIRRV